MEHIFVHLEIPSDDVKRAVNFYWEIFGWKFEPMEGMPDYQLFRPSEDQKDLGGAVMARQQPMQGPLPYIQVESVNAYSEKIETLGGKILVPKMAVGGMGWMAVFQDTEGNILGIFEPDTSAK